MKASSALGSSGPACVGTPRLVDDRVDRAVVVGPRGVDRRGRSPRGTPARPGRLGSQRKNAHQPAQVGVHPRQGALQHQAAHELGVPQCQLLADDAAAREAGHVRGRDVESAQDRGGVVGHHLHGRRSVGHPRAARAAVVEGRQPVAVGQPVELELPRLDGVAEAADQQDVRSLAHLLGPDVQVTGPDVLSHLEPSHL